MVSATNLMLTKRLIYCKHMLTVVECVFVGIVFTCWSVFDVINAGKSLNLHTIYDEFVLLFRASESWFKFRK